MADAVRVIVPQDLAEELTESGFEEVKPVRGVDAQTVLTTVEVTVGLAANLVTILVAKDQIGDVLRTLRHGMKHRTGAAPDSKVTLDITKPGPDGETRIRIEFPPDADIAAVTAQLHSLLTGPAVPIPGQTVRSPSDPVQQLLSLHQAADATGKKRAWLRRRRQARVRGTAWKLQDQLMAAAEGGGLDAVEDLFTVARLSLLYEFGVQHWRRAGASGLAMAGAVARMQEMAGYSDQPGPEVRSRLIDGLRGIPDLVAYAEHRAGRPASGLTTAESLISVFLAERMIDRSLTRLHEQGSGAEELRRLEELRQRINETRDRSTVEPAGTVEDLNAIIEKHWHDELALLDSASLTVPYLGTRNQIAPMSASRTTGRALVYVSGAGPGGVAIRLHLGPDSGRLAESVELSGFTQEEMNKQAATIQRLCEGAAVRTQPILDGVATRVWNVILEAWPDLISTPAAIIPLGSAARLPFYTAPVGGKPICAQMNLTVAPSARALLLAAAWPSASGTALVAADTGGGTIPLVIPEAEAIAGIHNTTPLILGSAMDRTVAPGRLRRLRDAPPAAHTAEPDAGLVTRLGQASVIHLACHGRLRPDDPLTSTLDIGDTVSLRQLLASDLQAGALVVLSACSLAGTGTAHPAEQLGFPAALIAMGARSVIAALWPVQETHSTVELMTRFHDRLSTTPPAVALGETIGELHADGVPPAVWGPLTHFGA